MDARTPINSRRVRRLLGKAKLRTVEFGCCSDAIIHGATCFWSIVCVFLFFHYYYYFCCCHIVQGSILCNVERYTRLQLTWCICATFIIKRWRLNARMTYTERSSLKNDKFDCAHVRQSFQLDSPLLFQWYAYYSMVEEGTVGCGLMRLFVSSSADITVDWIYVLISIQISSAAWTLNKV